MDMATVSALDTRQKSVEVCGDECMFWPTLYWKKKPKA